MIASAPVVTMKAVRSMGGSRALAGTFSAVAPSSTYVLPTNTLVVIPEPPAAVTNGWPVPRMVMTGGTTSGAANSSVVAAAAVAMATALAPEDMVIAEEELLPLPLPSLLPLLPNSSAARFAASAPQFPLMLQANVMLLHVFSDGPQGSYTVSVRMPVMDWLAASEAVYVTMMGWVVTVAVKLLEKLGRPTTVTAKERPRASVAVAPGST